MVTTTGKKRRTPAQLATEGFSALVKKLGIVDAIRFLHTQGMGHGDYTRERSQLLGHLSVEDVDRLVAKAGKKRPVKKKR